MGQDSWSKPNPIIFRLLEPGPGNQIIQYVTRQPDDCQLPLLSVSCGVATSFFKEKAHSIRSFLLRAVDSCFLNLSNAEGYQIILLKSRLDHISSCKGGKKGEEALSSQRRHKRPLSIHKSCKVTLPYICSRISETLFPSLQHECHVCVVHVSTPTLAWHSPDTYQILQIRVGFWKLVHLSCVGFK